MTHKVPPADEKLPGPKAVLFFASEQVARRQKDWGWEELYRQVGEAVAALAGYVMG